jgi:hypothetical protein
MQVWISTCGSGVAYLDNKDQQCDRWEFVRDSPASSVEIGWRLVNLVHAIYVFSLIIN